MARGSSNPMQDHHKKARQKEAKRNRIRRGKERDEVALQTKTVKQVKEEIQKLERDMKRHHHGPQQRDNAEKKLTRLKKELALLQDAEKAAKAKADADAEAYRIANKYRQPQRPPTELDDPRKSVYYDPVMNPFGAPPPGKPRLYHRRFGGVTPNPNEAVVPGEEPPPPPPRDTRPHHHHRNPNNHNSNHHQRQNLQRPPQNRQAQEQQRGEPSSQSDQNAPKRQPLHMPPPKKLDQNNEEATNDSSTRKTDNSESSNPRIPKEEEKPTTDRNDKPSNDATTQEASQTEAKSSSPPIIPSLPAPSAAVQRTMRVARNKSKIKRGKALADIWASTEEVEYERLANLVDLEADDVGTAAAKTKKKKKKKKKKKPPLEFYYRDNSGTVQGPYSKAQMRNWIDAGYFPLTTKARTNRMDPDGWVPMGDLPALKEEPVSSKNEDNSVQDRIAALKSGENNDDENKMDVSMQARIAAMRADLMASSKPSENPIDEDSVQGRIAALKGNTNNDDDEEGVDASMQARIAAMKADLMPSSAPNNPNDDDDNVQARIAALKGNAHSSVPSDDEGTDPSIQDRIAAMRADIAGPSAAAGEETYEVEASMSSANEEMSIQDRIAALRKNAPPQPAALSQHVKEEGTGNLSLQDRIAALRQNAPPPPPPPPPAYPVGSDNQYSVATGASAYPIGDTDDVGASAYPIDNEDPYGVAAYPTGDEEEDGMAAYPLDGTNDQDEAYAPYPTDEAYPGAEDLAYPVTDSYPVEEDHDDLPPYAVSDVNPASEENVGPLVPASKTKVVKVDKALVSFVPSNLQNKRKAAEAPGSNEDLKKKKKPTKQDDNYDKFLKEIDDL